MNKLIIISLTLLFFTTSKLSFTQLYPVQKTGSDHIARYGFIDKKGKQIVPFIYDNAGTFSEGLCAVFQNEKGGYINSSGEIIIPIKYDHAQEFHNGYAIAFNEGSRYLIDQKGEEFPMQKLYHTSENIYSEGLIIVMNEDEQLGYANLKNEIIIPCQFDYATSFSGGYATGKQGDNVYIIDKKGTKTTLDCKNTIGISEGLIGIQNEDDIWGVIDINLNVITDFNYVDLYPFKNGYAQFKEFYDMGLLNARGESVLPTEYTYVHPMSENRIFVQPSETSAILMDENFKVLKEFPNFYKSFGNEFIYRDGLALVYLVVGPQKGSSNESIRLNGGFAATYINLNGDVIWQGEVYEKQE